MTDEFYAKLAFEPFTVEYDDNHGLRTRSDATYEKVRPGAVLRLKPVEDRAEEPDNDSGHMTDARYVLVGDVNKLLGVCDDCMTFCWEDIEAIAYLDAPARA